MCWNFHFMIFHACLSDYSAITHYLNNNNNLPHGMKAEAIAKFSSGNNIFWSLNNYYTFCLTAWKRKLSQKFETKSWAKKKELKTIWILKTVIKKYLLKSEILILQKLFGSQLQKIQHRSHQVLFQRPVLTDFNCLTKSKTIRQLHCTP